MRNIGLILHAIREELGIPPQVSIATA